MVRVTSVLSRVPVIKFRKGGMGRTAAAPAATAPGSCPATAVPAAQAQPAAAMSTGAIPDIDLPARYRRQPLSDEEIAHINGGGIKDASETPKAPKPPKALGIIKIPHGVLIESGKNSKEVVSLNIILQKSEMKKT